MAIAGNGVAEVGAEDTGFDEGSRDAGVGDPPFRAGGGEGLDVDLLAARFAGIVGDPFCVGGEVGVTDFTLRGAKAVDEI